MTSGLDLAEVSKSHAPQLTDVPAAPGLINEKNEKRLTIADDSSQTLSFAEPEGTEYPTADEVATLRRVCGTIPWSAYTIGFVELCERFSYYGTTQVCKSIAVASD
jgi:POT family proton-dependent oligopeptide transporter